jgi:hypothetical protein
MKRGADGRGATVGVAEHVNTMVLVTIDRNGQILDRRQIQLTDHECPTHPHHHEGSWAVGRYLTTPGARAISLADAVALVERVSAAALEGARRGLAELATSVETPIGRLALRTCAPLPPTIEERIHDNRAQTMADSIMYRRALAAAAEARGWSVVWYDRDRVFREASEAVDGHLDGTLKAMGQRVGRPWQAKHKLAAAAALAAAARAAQPPALY